MTLATRLALPWRAAAAAALLALLPAVACSLPATGGSSPAAPAVARSPAPAGRSGDAARGGLTGVPLALAQDGSKLTAGEERGEGHLGYSVALSADGSTALIGAYDDNGGVGAAWVFTRSGTTWTQQGPVLTGGGEVGAGEFGRSVALSADGDTAAIGGDYDNGQLGAAWVFTRAGATWRQQGEKLTGGGEHGPGLFGTSVALSADGSTALIGGEGDEGYTSAARGAAWVFTRSGTTWTQQGEKLIGAGETGGAQVRSGHFGYSVALSADDSTALVGGYGDNGGFGAAWVYTRAEGVWTQQGAKLTGGGEEGRGAFASSVALSGDGDTALIGAPGNNNGFGATWVFTRSGTTWTQQGERFTGAAKNGASAFGISAALSADGSTALIGGSADNGGVGAAWVYTRAGTTWAQQGYKLTGSGRSGPAGFGASGALSEDGSTALIGGANDNASAGAAWVFSDLPSLEPLPGAASSSTTPVELVKPPAITDVTQSHRVWREGEALAVIARRRTPSPRGSGHGRPPLGTNFSFALSGQANVAFAFIQQQRWRRVRGRCVIPTRTNRHAPRCAATATEGALSFAGHAGVNRVSFQGRDSYLKKLSPGRYTLVITASNPAGSAEDSSLTFTIVRQ